VLIIAVSQTLTVCGLVLAVGGPADRRRA